MKEVPGEIEQLLSRIEGLERRVAALEKGRPVPAPSAAAQAALSSPDEDSFAETIEAGSVFSVLGRAMLGIAGAYVLRAAAQSNLVPSLAAAALGVPYAIGWVVLAARRQAADWFAATVYAVTSALILGPMLWELVFRFHAFSASGAAAVVAAYVVAATALAWKRNVVPVFWISNLAAVTIALSMFFAARSVVPFIAVLLLMLGLAGFAETRGKEHGTRSLLALAASAAVWAAIYVYISPAETRPEYPIVSRTALIAPGFALLFIYLAGVVFNTAVKRRRITVFEIVQTVIAFLLAAVGLISFGPHWAPVLFGILCLVIAAGAYATVYLVFDGAPNPRNYQVFSAWSAALFLAGCFMSLPDTWEAPCLGVAAIAASVIGTRFGRLVLAFHGTVYLAGAAAASGLAVYALHALTGTLPPAPPWGVYLTLFFAILCYAAMSRGEAPSWRQETLRLLVAALAIFAAAALVVHGLMGLTALRIEPRPHHLAFFRTLAVCAAALGLAYSGSRWRRVELTRIAYAALVLLAVKLVAEDLRHSQLAYIAGSIFLFALTLIAVPRVARRGRKAPAAEKGTGLSAGRIL